MLKYPNILITGAVLLIITVIAGLFTEIPAIVYFLPVVATIAVLVWGSASVSSGIYLPVHCHGDRSSNRIALTFDDGPEPASTNRILDILGSHGIKAAFFCIGIKAGKHPEVIQRINREGHLVGSHSNSHHFLFDLFRDNRLTVELVQASDVIEAAIGRKPRLFRPPYGVLNPPLARVLKNLNYTVVGWSLRSMDTVAKDSKKLEMKLRKVKGGDVVLLHDSGIHTASALDWFISHARSKNLVFERPDRLLNIEAYE